MKLILLSTLIVAAYCVPQHNNPRWQHYLNSEIDKESPRSTLVSPSTTAPLRKPTELELEQNRNANYSFHTNVVDGINDQSQQRTEVRSGLKVEGSYSYSDGFFQRTYHYLADDKGYRIVKSEVKPLEGPKVNHQGTASVDTAAHGGHLSYKIQSIQAVGPKIVDKIE